MAPSQTVPGPTSHSYTSARLRLHYVDWGNPAAPLLVLVHGGRDHCRTWDWVARALRDEYHIVAPDLRGHGDSQWAVGSPYALPEFVLDLTRLLEHLGEEPVHLLGHSLGAATALLTAGIYPDRVRRLVAVDGFGPPPGIADVLAQPAYERQRRWADDLRAAAARTPRRYDSSNAAVERMLQANPHLTRDQAHHLTINGVLRNEDGSYSWKFDPYFRVLSPYRYEPNEVHAMWGRIACPTLLISGGDSPMGQATLPAVRASIAQVEELTIEGAGHWVHHDRLEEFVHRVGEFLTR